MKYLITNFSCFLAAALLPYLGQGQTFQPIPLPQIIPPSPTAAGLAKYAAIPVNQYTGIPSISIPLYNIKVRDITVPISLSYHGGGGIRVDEEASWVGLGWSLNAGGVITCTIRGKNDLIHYNQNMYPVPIRGFSYSDECTISGNNTTIDTRTLAGSANEWDPDTYFFNFLSYTGKFIFQQEFINGVSVVTPRILDQQKMRIEHLSTGAFRLTSADGFRYTFAAAENYNTQGESSFNAWYLTNITSALGEEINFVYGYGREATAPISSLGVVSTKAVHNPPTGLLDRMPTWTTTRISARYLERIEYRTGHVEFIRDQVTNREDISGGQRLQAIRIFETGTASPVKEFTLSTSYKTSPAETYVAGGGTGVPNGGSSNYSVNQDEHGYAAKRMQLDQVTESANGQTKPPYRFTYNSRLLPYKTSYSRDHWGLFNGAQNVDLVPAYKGFQTGYSNTYVELQGANREPNPAFATAGLLETIQYPTGGTTRFLYEGNEYGNLTLQERMRNIVHTKEVIHNWSAGQSTAPVVERFTIPTNNGSNGFSTLTSLVVRFYAGYDGTQTAPCGNSALELYRTEPGQAQQFLQSWTMCAYQPTPSNPVPRPPDFYLPGGTYELRSRIAPNDLANTQNLFMQGRLSWNEQVEETDVSLLRKPGPGVRIARVTESAGNGTPDIIREYKYDRLVDAGGPKMVSQGVVMTHPRYDRGKRQWYIVSSQPGACGPNNPDCAQPYQMQAFQLCSNSVVQLSNAAQGSPIGYTRVEEWNGIGRAGGFSVYEYYNSANITPPTAINSIPAVSNPLNGYLLKRTDYRRNADGTMRKVLQRSNTYSIANQQVIPGAVKELDRPNRYVYRNTLNVEAFCEMPVYFYQIFSQWVQLSETQEHRYDSQDESKFQTTTTRYRYDVGNRGHMQVSQVEVAQSDGSTSLTSITYPADYPNVTSGSLAAMRSDAVYQHKAVVEKVTQVYQAGQTAADAKTVAGNYVEYAQPSPVGRYLPITQYALELDRPTAYLGATAPDLPPVGRYALQAQLSYDPVTANMRQVQKRFDVPTSYVWGYGQTLPLAEVQNAAHDQVAATSFEPDSPGGWSFGGADGQPNHRIITSGAHAGRRCYRLDTGWGCGTTVAAAGDYVLSFWASSEPVVYSCRNGQCPLLPYRNRRVGPLVNGFRLYTYEATLAAGTSLNIDAHNADTPVLLDDVRLHPVGAQMTTFTHDPLVGVTSKSDAANLPTYYEYDALGRLKHVKDLNGHVVAQQEYHYKP